MFSTRSQRASIRAILGRDAGICDLELLQRTRRARTFRFRLDGRPGWYVLKTGAREARHLEAIQRAPDVRAPRYLGGCGDWFVQEFVEGTSFRRLEPDLPRDARLAAVDNLAAIHAALPHVAPALRLDLAFGRDAIAHRLLRIGRRIESDGLPAFERLGGSARTRWRGLVSESLVAKLVDDLQSTPDDSILGHGEYRRDHLIRSPSGEVFAIDWATLALASPWYDLAYLVPAGGPSEALSFYLERVQRRGALAGLSEARAARLATSGVVYAELLQAGRNIRPMRSTGKLRFAQRFADHLDAALSAAG